MSTTFLIRNGDVVIGVQGSPALVAGKAKLSQDLSEAFTTAQGTNNIGTGLDELIGTSASPLTLRSTVTRRIRTGLEAMKSLQTRFGRANRTPDERVNRLAEVTVRQQEGSPMTFVFQVAVISDAGESVAVGGTLN